MDRDGSIDHVTADAAGAIHARVQLRVLEVILLLVLLLILILILTFPLPPTFQAESFAAGLAALHPGARPITAKLVHMAPAAAAASRSASSSSDVPASSTSSHPDLESLLRFLLDVSRVASRACTSPHSYNYGSTNQYTARHSHPLNRHCRTLPPL